MVSIQDFEEEIWGSNPHRLQRRMNIYTFDIFTNHCIAVEEIDEADRIGFHLDLLVNGPLYLPEPSHLKVVKEADWNISSLPYLQTGRQDYHHDNTSLDFCKQEQNFQTTELGKDRIRIRI